jgi:hypothetical protein
VVSLAGGGCGEEKEVMARTTFFSLTPGFSRVFGGKKVRSRFNGFFARSKKPLKRFSHGAAGSPG